jgi:succinoglycan biosynthesis protein ExoM
MQNVTRAARPQLPSQAAAEALAQGPKIALCLCTYRRQHLLNNLLAYLRRIPELPPKVDIIVADNQVSSETADIVAQYFPDAYYLQVPRRGLSEARNATVAQALFIGAEILVFLDDDDLPRANWLTALLDRQRATGAALVFGATVKADRPAPHVARGTCNALVMATALKSLDGLYFDPMLNFVGGEDALFFARIEALHGPGAEAPASIIFKNLQPGRQSWRGQLREAFNIGYRHVYIARLYGRWQGRTACGQTGKEVAKLLKAVAGLPLFLIDARLRAKLIRRLGGAAGATYALIGGKSEPYRNPKF